MKRLYSQEPLKTHLLYKSRKALRRIKGKPEPPHRAKISREEAALQRLRREAITIDAPSNFSFIHNPEAYIEFLNRITEAAKRKPVFIDISQITELTTDAIYTLLCKASDANFTHRRPIYCNRPKDQRLSEIWAESGFNKYLTSGFEEYAGNAANIRNHWSNDVVADYSDKLIRFATQKILGAAKHCKGIQRTYVEVMSNTIQHATGKGTWWTAVFCDQSNAVACYTFVDSGIGIFQSAKMLAFRLREKLTNLLGYSNVDLLKDILGGKSITATRQGYRGQGLFSIGKVAGRNQMKNLILISNDVYANITTKQFRILSAPYKGTFYYWEYDASCN
jgi:hypothetical protein